MLTQDKIAFLADLNANNSREWFQRHRPRYDAALRLPAKEFAAALEAEFSVRYGASATAKIFRINRDLRFPVTRRARVVATVSAISVSSSLL